MSNNNIENNTKNKIETTNNEAELQKMFPTVVGQRSLLNKLKFFIDIQNSNGVFPPILISGQLGAGKNTLASAILKNLKPKGNAKQNKTAIELNCSSIKTASQFFDEIVNVYLINKDITVILDEVHSWEGTDLIDVFLSIWNTKKGHINEYIHEGNTYSFDMSRISWICLTSEPNKLPDTLISRLEVFQLEELSLDDLSDIIAKRLDDIKPENKDLLLEVASVSRNNGRESYKLASNIYSYLKRNNKNQFTFNDWKDIKYKLGIRKGGINNIEYRVLQYLKDKPNGVSLSKLSSALQLTHSACRLGYERYLLGQDLINVVNAKGRVISKKGLDYLREVES